MILGYALGTNWLFNKSFETLLRLNKRQEIVFSRFSSPRLMKNVVNLALKKNSLMLFFWKALERLLSAVWKMSIIKLGHFYRTVRLKLVLMLIINFFFLHETFSVIKRRAFKLFLSFYLISFYESPIFYKAIILIMQTSKYAYINANMHFL